MSMLKISEAGSVQFPMVEHAAEIGWEPLTPVEALFRRGDESASLFRGLLEQKLLAFNPWLDTQGACLPPTVAIAWDGLVVQGTG